MTAPGELHAQNGGTRHTGEQSLCGPLLLAAAQVFIPLPDDDPVFLDVEGP
jgi:hypothetical protein